MKKSRICRSGAAGISFGKVDGGGAAELSAGKKGRAAVLFVLLLAVSLVASCTMPETKIYSLSLQDANGVAGAKPGASISIIMRAPRHLTQTYIAYRTSPYQLQISKYSKWEAAPDEMVKNAFRESLQASGMFRDVSGSGYVAAGSYSLDIDLKRFERADSNGEAFAELVYDFDLLSPDGKELHHGRISKRPKLDNKDFLGLAVAMSNALSESVEEVRKTVLAGVDAGK